MQFIVYDIESLKWCYKKYISDPHSFNQIWRDLPKTADFQFRFFFSLFFFLIIFTKRELQPFAHHEYNLLCIQAEAEAEKAA